MSASPPRSATLWRDPKLLKFLATGLLNTVFGYAVYAVLLVLNSPALLALLLATVAGVVFNYFSFGKMVFSGATSWRVFARFVAAYAIIYAVNAALLWLLTHRLMLNAFLAQALCIPVSVVLSWICMNHWVYKKD